MESRNLTYLFYGLAAAWAVIFIYVVSIVARERKLRRELDRVKRMIEERESKN